MGASYLLSVDTKPKSFPVAALSRKFRGRFMALITARLKELDLIIEQDIRKQCFDKDWVINSRPPAKGVNLVLEYIARYAFRVAITNSRIRKLPIQRPIHPQ